MGRLNGKVAIITGAGSGIGRAIAILFAKEGAKVVVADWVAKGGEETVKMIKEASGEAIYVYADVTKAEDVKKMVKAAADTYGKLDVILNGAGINPAEGSIVECPEEVFDKVIAINLKGVWLGMKYAIPEMLKAGGGSIINIASQAAFKAPPSISSYAASKGGIVAMSRATAVGFASKNIRINCIAPGPVATPLLLGQWSEEELQVWRNLTPNGRLGEMEEIAHLALYLASDESAHIIAQTVIIDGGMVADLHVGR